LGGRGGERNGIVTRRLYPLLLVAALLLVSSGVAARAQEAGAEDDFVARIAQERAAHGLPSFTVAADLQAVARRHAQRMADKGTHFHNPDLASEVQDWALVAENVGQGPNVEDLHAAFMASSQHRAAILHPDLTQIGVGVVRGSDGLLFVVQVFRQPMAAAPPPPPTTAPPPPTTASPVAASPITASAAPSPTTAPSTPPSSAPTTAPVVRPPSEAAASPTTVAPAPVAVEAAALSARQADLLRGSLARPVAARSPELATPDLSELATAVPPAAWVGAFLLAAVVALQGHTLRRLGLVR
jgi:hypothetical protein